jgi:RNA polymerase sigma-70 factor (ECF subfamily)
VKFIFAAKAPELRWVFQWGNNKGVQGRAEPKNGVKPCCGRMNPALKAWIETNLGRLYGYAFALTQDSDRSHDLVQECALRALGAGRRPTEEAAFRAWLFRILRNLYIDTRRKNRRECNIDPADLEIDDEPGGWAGDRRIVDIITVRIAMAKLSSDHRDIMALVDIVGLSYAETAEVLGIAEGTVMSRVSRARKALLTVITEENVTPLSRARRPV